MRVLVVGASGFIGRHLVLALARANHTVTGVFHRDESFPAFAREAGAHPEKCDLVRDDQEWDQEVCVYLAGNSNHAWSLAQPLEDMEMNLVALNRFLRGFSGNLIFLSSAAVYEGHRGSVTPDARVYPSLPYAISKLASEGYVHHYHNTGELAGFLILRLYYAYGPGERAGRLIGSLCRKVLLGGQRTFPVAGTGDSIIDPLYIDDVVDALVRALPHSASGGIYDLCAGQPRDVRQAIRDVAAVGGISVEIQPDPNRKEVPVRFWSDPSAARKALGLPPAMPLRDGVRAYLDWLEGGGA